MDPLDNIKLGVLTTTGPEPLPVMEFEFLTGDVNWEEYGGKFVSKKLNNGNFDYWLVIEVINWWEATGEGEHEFNVSINAVSPELNEGKVQELADEYAGDIEVDDSMAVEMLHTYGIYAQLWNKNGDDIEQLMREAKEMAPRIEMLFGFYMDRPMNRIGSTGWDVIQGDLLAGINR